MITDKPSYIAFYFMHSSDNCKKLQFRIPNILKKDILKKLLQFSAGNFCVKTKKQNYFLVHGKKIATCEGKTSCSKST